MKRIAIGVAVLAMAGLGVRAAATASPTFRTLARFICLAQRPVAQQPVIDLVPIGGHHLVNLFMGRDANDTSASNQVLALTLPCDLSAATLVIYNLTGSNVVAPLATSLRMDFVRDDTPTRNSRVAGEIVRFMTRLQIQPGGNEINAVLGGFLTVAGRVEVALTNGCPTPILVALDQTPLDRRFDDKRVPIRIDNGPDVRKLRTGLAHMDGVIYLVAYGTTNTMLVSGGNLNLQRTLPEATGP